MTPRRRTAWARWAPALLALAVAWAPGASGQTSTPTASAAPAPITVNSPGDLPDADPADGVCDTGLVAVDGTPECTLRAAIADANDRPGDDTVTVDPGLWGTVDPAGVDGVRLTPGTPYPAVTERLIIDGTGGAAGRAFAPDVTLDGSWMMGAPGLQADAPVMLRGVGTVAFPMAGDVVMRDIGIHTPGPAVEPDPAATPLDPGPEPTATAPTPAVTTPGPASTTPAPGPAATTPAPASTTPAPAPSSSPTEPDPGVPPPTTTTTGPSDPPVTPADPAVADPAPEPVAAPQPVTVPSTVSRIALAVTVNSTGDGADADPGDGVCATGGVTPGGARECTLRAAIEEANADLRVGAVVFAIPRSDPGFRGDPSATWTIRPRSPLPSIASPMSLDGSVQDGARCGLAAGGPAPSIVIDGRAAGPVGLRVSAADVRLHALAVDRVATPVSIAAPATGTAVTCSVLGVPVGGQAPTDGLRASVAIDGATGATIGGVTPVDGNLVATGASGTAVRVTGTTAAENTVIGNAIVGGGTLMDAGPRGDATGAGAPATPAITSARPTRAGVAATLAAQVPAGEYVVEFSSVAGAGTPTATTAPVATFPLTSTGAALERAYRLDAPGDAPVVATLTAAPSGASRPLGATSQPSAVVTPMAARTVSGTVREDVNGDGVLTDAVAASGAAVWVFRDQGDGVPDAGDPVEASTRTDAGGAWSVTVNGDGTYWVATDSRSVLPSQGFRGGFARGDAWADQTYASAGAMRVAAGDTSATPTAAAGPLPGGMRADVADGFPLLPASEHVQKVVVSGGNAGGIVQAFSFASVTHTRDATTPPKFTDPASWASIDPNALGLGVDPVGYAGAATDGRYVYFAPSRRTSGMHGEVRRYDTRAAFGDVASWSTFDPGDHGVGSDPDGYQAALFDGRYVYFAPLYNGTAAHGEVLRYDTTLPFGAASSWLAFDPGANGVGADADGFSGMAFDGQYVYFSPLDNGTGASGEVLRLDTRGAFDNAASWGTYDPSANGVGSDARGFSDVIKAGPYMIFAANGRSGGAGEVMAYDTRQAFGAAFSWTAFEPAAHGLGTGPQGYTALAGDGRYVYFAPYDSTTGASGLVLRFDAQAAGGFADAASWSTFDLTAVDANAVGFRTATFDGRYVYLGQDSSSTGAASRVARYDTTATFGAAGSWTVMNLGAAGVGTDPDGARGAAFDGRYLYVSHLYNGTDYSGEVERYDTGRTGQGSLRQFLLNANALVGVQTSAFRIPDADAGRDVASGRFVIRPVAPLPAITDPVTLDGRTQPAGSAVPRIVLDGASAAGAPGIDVASGTGTTVAGLAVGGFADVAGVRAGAPSTTLEANWIGLGASGAANPNAAAGVRVAADAVVIGDTPAAYGNVISGNGGAGVLVAAGGTRVDIVGNRIGTNPGGTAAVPNAGGGVDVAAAGAGIGGPNAGEGNVISGNTGAGVALRAGASGATVAGNTIGADAAGTAALPNTGPGVWVGANGAAIGSNKTSDANVVAHNGGPGVAVDGAASGVGVLGNHMYLNGGLGIDLNAATTGPGGPFDGVTANDALDADSGGNGLLNRPVLQPLLEHGGTVDAVAALDVPAGTYRLEFFRNPRGADPSGSGEGETLVATASVTHPGGGSVDFTVPLTVSPGTVVTATATRIAATDTTSEFSAARTVAAGNDPPVNTVPADQAITDDDTLTFASGTATALSTRDPDVGAGTLEATLTVTAGTLTLADITGLTFTAGDGTADATMTFTGAQTAVNAALNGAVYTPPAGYGGTVTATMTVDDQGNTGAGGALSDNDTFDIEVTSVNSAPVHTVPADRTVAEDTNVTFSAAGGTRIAVADSDAGSSPVKVTLTAANGTLTLGGTAGLVFTTGDGSLDVSMTFRGTLASVNAALDGLQFTPTADVAGAASVTITTDDEGNTGTGGAKTATDTVGITLTAVNDAPVNRMPAPITASSGSAVTLSAARGTLMGVDDVDAGTSPLRVRLTATHGTLTLARTTGLSFATGDGSLDAALEFTGAQADVRAALDGMTFLAQSGFSGSASIAVDTNDQGAAGAGGAKSDADTLAITLTPASNPPVLDAIPDMRVDEERTLAFTAHATSPTPARTITYSVVGAPAGFTGDPAAGTAQWTPTEAQGPGTYTFVVVATDDAVPAASAHQTVTITVDEVNRPPVLTALTAQTNGEGDTVSLTPSATDPDIPDNTFTWSATGLPDGLSIDPATGLISGTIARGAAQGSPYQTTITVRDDAGASATRTGTWTVTGGNNAPVIDAVAAATVPELALASHRATARDPNGDTVRFSLRGAPAGATVDPVTGEMSWTPTEAQGPGTYTFAVIATDDGVPAMPAETPVQVTVTEVNSAPVVAAIPDTTARVGDDLAITVRASDGDLPANTLTRRVAGPPGVRIGPTGNVLWSPKTTDIGRNVITVTVTDDGSPALSTTVTFVVTVSAAPPPAGADPSPGAAPPDAPGSGPEAPAAAPPAPATPAPSGPQTDTARGPAPSRAAPDGTASVEPGAGDDPRPAADRPSRPQPAGAPAAPGVVTPGPALTPQQIASRRLGTGLARRLSPPRVAVPPSPRSAPVEISVKAPLSALVAVRDIDVPTAALSLSGASVLTGAMLVWWRRRRVLPYLVADVDPRHRLVVRTRRDRRGDVAFLLRHDAGPLWSVGRRRRGRRTWVKVLTPGGVGHVDARRLADARDLAPDASDPEGPAGSPR